MILSTSTRVSFPLRTLHFFSRKTQKHISFVFEWRLPTLFFLDNIYLLLGIYISLCRLISVWKGRARQSTEAYQERTRILFQFVLSKFFLGHFYPDIEYWCGHVYVIYFRIKGIHFTMKYIRCLCRWEKQSSFQHLITIRKFLGRVLRQNSLYRHWPARVCSSCSV